MFKTDFQERYIIILFCEGYKTRRQNLDFKHFINPPKNKHIIIIKKMAAGIKDFAYRFVLE